MKKTTPSKPESAPRKTSGPGSVLKSSRYQQLVENLGNNKYTEINRNRVARGTASDELNGSNDLTPDFKVVAQRIGEQLKAFRLAAGLTQKELAERIGSTYGNVQRLERGHTNPTIKTIAMYAHGVGKSIRDINFD